MYVPYSLHTWYATRVPNWSVKNFRLKKWLTRGELGCKLPGNDHSVLSEITLNSRTTVFKSPRSTLAPQNKPRASAGSRHFTLVPSARTNPKHPCQNHRTPRQEPHRPAQNVGRPSGSSRTAWTSPLNSDITAFVQHLWCFPPQRQLPATTSTVPVCENRSARNSAKNLFGLKCLF